MGVVAYSLLAYLVMAVISLIVVGIIVSINKIFSSSEEESPDE